MSDRQKRQSILESLEDMPPDILDLLYMIVYYIDSGLE